MPAGSNKTSGGFASEARPILSEGEHARGYWHLVCRCLFAAFVVASLVHILKALQLPLELPAVVLANQAAVANQVAQFYDPEHKPLANDERRWLAVAAIDETRFRGAYQGVRPLDRCQLKRDLEPILANEDLRTVAVDLDLSPTVATDAGSRDCQTELEKLLKKYAKKLILIRPLTTEDRAWASDIRKEAPSLTFASPRFLAQFGVAWKWKWKYDEE